MAEGASLCRDDYTVGWLCALPVEIAAAKLMLDSVHPSLPLPSADQNTYILGNIGDHNIVIACLPVGAYGTISAATVATQLLSSFHAIRFGLMVGISGGVPSGDADIRLGDIVVSQPTGTTGGVVQYDLGRAISGGRFQRKGMLNRPPKILLTALATLQAQHLTEDSRVPEFLSDIKVKMPRKAANFARPSHEDRLYQAEYEHGTSSTCIDCDRSQLILRPSRGDNDPAIHYGLIASANQVIKNGRRRDQLAQELGVYCVEMEAAGLMNDFPCLVIRGICDYSDSHKNKQWQGYAAATAAAYAKELLLVVPTNQIDKGSTAQEAAAHSVPGFSVPLNLTAVPVIEGFLGRQNELEDLWAYLRPRNDPSRKVAIVHGLGGMGKTQLAIRFARDHKNDFTAIFWLSGKDRGTLLQSLSSVLPRLPGQTQKDEDEVEKRARRVLQWLSREGNSRWLIIFDNIDQYSRLKGAGGDEYDIGEFFPTADHGSIIITSRLQGLTELGKSFPINKLGFEDAIQLLLQNSGLSAKNSTMEMESNLDVFTLANRLDGLPLALAIAGAFMRETGTSITEYLKYYQESWSELQLQSSPNRQYEQGNILQTWMISYREIKRRDLDAAELLLLLACFDNGDIWYELIENGSRSSNLPSWFQRTVSNGLAFKTRVKTLIGFSLLETKEQGGSYAIHPVVQDWCVHVAKTDQHVDFVQLKELALISVGYALPDQDGNHSLQRRLLPHANFVRDGNWSGNNIPVWVALNRVGCLYRYEDRLREAEQILQQAHLGFKRALGPDNELTGNVANSLGCLYLDQCKSKEAGDMFQQAISGCQTALGPDDISTLMKTSNLGRVYFMQGKLEEAEKIYQQVLPAIEKAMGPDHRRTLRTLRSLAIVHEDQGKFKQAEEMYQRVLLGFEKMVGRDHPSSLKMLHKLGRLYRKEGNPIKAQETYQEALLGLERVMGPDHTSTLDTVCSLGHLYNNQGEFDAAEEMYKRALFGFQKVLGHHHPTTAKVANALARLLLTRIAESVGIIYPGAG